jgi:hypothetical protein
MFTDWNHAAGFFKKAFVAQRVVVAIDHSQSPFTLAEKLSIRETLQKGSDMDFNQWYGMLQAGNWYDAAQKLLTVQCEENATREGTLQEVTDGRDSIPLSSTLLPHPSLHLHSTSVP